MKIQAETSAEFSLIEGVFNAMFKEGSPEALFFEKGYVAQKSNSVCFTGYTPSEVAELQLPAGFKVGSVSVAQAGVIPVGTQYYTSPGAEPEFSKSEHRIPYDRLSVTGKFSYEGTQVAVLFTIHQRPNLDGKSRGIQLCFADTEV